MQWTAATWMSFVVRYFGCNYSIAFVVWSIAALQRSWTPCRFSWWSPTVPRRSIEPMSRRLSSAPNRSGRFRLLLKKWITNINTIVHSTVAWYVRETYRPIFPALVPRHRSSLHTSLLHQTRTPKNEEQSHYSVFRYDNKRRNSEFDSRKHAKLPETFW